jgi:ATP-dependent exoDNAse (exonuclease V) beta subunit
MQHPNVTIQVVRERPFAMREEEALVYGIIDRLVLFWQEERVIAADILDFKSEVVAIGDAAAIAATAARYQARLVLYQRAVARLYALDTDRIVTRLLFVRCGMVQRVTG